MAYADDIRTADCTMNDVADLVDGLAGSWTTKTLSTALAPQTGSWTITPTLVSCRWHSLDGGSTIHWHAAWTSAQPASDVTYFTFVVPSGCSVYVLDSDKCIGTGGEINSGHGVWAWAVSSTVVRVYKVVNAPFYSSVAHDIYISGTYEGA